MPKPFEVVAAHEIVSPGAYPDAYTRTNRYAFRFPPPAAGADIALTVPNGVFWDVNSLTALLTTSGSAANRLVGFFVKDQEGRSVYQYQTTTALTASQTCTFTFSEDFAAVATTPANGGNILWPAPKPLLLPGWTLGTVTAAIAAADQWSNVTCWVEEYLPPAGE